MRENANRTEGHSEINWPDIGWRPVTRNVRNLSHRIFRATQEGDWDKVQSLQRLMLRSTSNAALSVRRVTQVNQGKNTPGIDKIVVKTPAARSKLLNDIINNSTPWRASPAKGSTYRKPMAACDHLAYQSSETEPCKQWSRTRWNHHGRRNSKHQATDFAPVEEVKTPS